MTSKHKMAADSVVQRVLGEMAVRYVNTYKTNVHGFALIPKLESGFVWWDYFTSPQHTN